MDLLFLASQIPAFYSSLPFEIPKALQQDIALYEAVQQSSHDEYDPNIDQLAENPKGVEEALNRLAASMTIADGWTAARLQMTHQTSRRLVHSAYAAGDACIAGYAASFATAAKDFVQAAAKLPTPPGYLDNGPLRTVTSVELLDGGHGDAYLKAKQAEQALREVAHWIEWDARIPLQGNADFGPLCIFDCKDIGELNVVTSAETAPLWEGIDGPLSWAATRTRLNKPNIAMKPRRASAAAIRLLELQEADRDQRARQRDIDEFEARDPEGQRRLASKEAIRQALGR